MSAAATACSGGGDDAAGGGETPDPRREVSRTLPDIDPPLRFAADGTSLGTFDRTQGYVVDDAVLFHSLDGTQLVSHDLATDKRRLSVSFDSYNASLSPPTVSNGRVFVTYLTEVRGTGTLANRYMTRVQALDAKTGRTLWAINLKKHYSSALEAKFASRPHIFAADAQHVVVEAHFDQGTYTALLAADKGTLLWDDPLFVPVAFDGQVVAGQVLSPGGNVSLTEGRAVADGRHLWKLPAKPPVKNDLSDWGSAYGVPEAGSTHQAFFLARIDEATAAEPPPHVLLYRVADGKRFLGLDDAINNTIEPGDCRDDGRRTIVCGTDRVVVAYDDRSGKKLWKLPDEAAGRVAPGVTAVRHGIVYGTTDNGAVALDARTGRDRTTDLSIAPEYVGRGFGLAYGETAGDQDELYVYPAVD
ncbi:outer membrane protein assembly factor BamB family protein [Streptomyces olivaceoviridis]|uniref:outer membrane protein assembly factor BamB family protein n=1 Tax=Streptomyces olivaceoviridis TaxID=1921 RepID=UPI0036B57159